MSFIRLPDGTVAHVRLGRGQKLTQRDIESIQAIKDELFNHKQETKMAEGTVDSTSDARTVNNVMRHQYRVLSDVEKQRMQAIKDKGLELHELITGIGRSRELSLAATKTEEAVMWAVKHITG